MDDGISISVASQDLEENDNLKKYCSAIFSLEPAKNIIQQSITNVSETVDKIVAALEQKESLQEIKQCIDVLASSLKIKEEIENCVKTKEPIRILTVFSAAKVPKLGK